MKIESVTILGRGLPVKTEPAGELSRLRIRSLGPVLDCDTLRLLEETFKFAEMADLHVAGYLSQPAYEVLAGSFMVHSPVAQYLRPVACSFTELHLSPEQIQGLPLDEALMDQVIERYISNLLNDLQTFHQARLPHVDIRITGSYLSRQSADHVTCHPIPRILTPGFGTLTFVASDSEPLATLSSYRSRGL